MKNTGKIRSGTESYSASEAAALLGVSIPTLKRMVAEGRLESFRTPGGHVRILRDSVEGISERRPERFHPVRQPSAVLQNRRERLEELTLEAQEMRAKRELVKLQREERAETERRMAEEDALAQEAAEREAELDLDRERLEQRRVQRLELKESERDLAAFRCHWLEEINQILGEPESRWLSAAQRKEIIEAVEVEIEKRDPSEQAQMVVILRHTVATLVEQYQDARQAEGQRQEVTKAAVGNVSVYATDEEKALATTAVRDALRRLDKRASESEVLTAARKAVQPTETAIARRLLEERVISWATFQLPWQKTELEALRVRRECVEILAELPEDFSEVEAKEALEPTVREASQDIEQRLDRQARQTRRTGLIEQGVAEVLTYLFELKRKGEISDEEYWDSELTEHLRERVRRGVESKLSGDEATKKVRELVHRIIDRECQ